MKRIKIIFSGVGCSSRYQVFVKIYDVNNILVFSGYTHKGFIIAELEVGEVYSIIATSYNDKLSGSFYLSKNKDKYYFVLPSSIHEDNLNTITFLLTDYNYDNLPIERGELILWQEL